MIPEITHSANVFWTKDNHLASALATLGIPRLSPFSQRTVVNGVDEVTFYFEKTENLKMLVAAWENMAKFRAENPEHPISYIYGYMENRNRLLDHIKRADRLIFEDKMIGGIKRTVIRTEKYVAR